MKHKKLKILFCGELPPVNVHGASVSNRINLDILSEIADITVIEEKWNVRDHNQFSIFKIFRNFRSAVQIVGVSITNSYDLFYSVFSISLFGGAKNLLNIVTAKIMNPGNKLLIHIHRSDLIHQIEKSRIYRFYIKILNRIGSTFILLSNQQQKECQSYLDRSEVLYNCINEDEIYSLDQTKKNKIIRILFISNYIKEKGILDLLVAFRRIKKKDQIRLDCYGAFSDDQTKLEIKRLSEDVNHISVHGPVYGEDKNRVMNAADIVILPSYNEGLSLVMLEALRVQKPIIISKRGYSSEILGEDYPLYCIPGDIDSIEEKLILATTLCNDSEFQNRLKTIYENYSFEKHKSKIIEIVDKLVLKV